MSPDVRADSSIDLLVRAQGGDDDALNRLLARYLPRLQRWASGRLPGGARDLLDTGDLVQEAVVRALRHLDTLEIRSEGALQAYLRQVVNNRIIDLYRQSGRRPVRDELSTDVEARTASPLEVAIGSEALDRYEAALIRLSEAERQAIVLRVEMGYDYTELAAELKKPTPAAARMAVTRALARLAQEMTRIATDAKGTGSPAAAAGESPATRAAKGPPERRSTRGR
jgi:RNA polymerase sigma-70 factor (ECF subfamily)